ncbi:MAG: cell division protein FtsZ, partial [Atribacterota bacterium]|nr:cell division protein FtsZ [Atribacterota bacterium]
KNMTLFEVNKAAEIVQEAANEDANIIFGAVINESLGEDIRITVIATGFDEKTPEEKEREQIKERIMETKKEEYVETKKENNYEIPVANNDYNYNDLEIPTFLRKNR